MTVLDYGCVSGILAKFAKKLNAKTVVGTDIDPQAIESALTNAERNQCEIEFTLPKEFDILAEKTAKKPWLTHLHDHRVDPVIFSIDGAKHLPTARSHRCLVPAK